MYCGGPFSNSAGRYSCQTRASKVSYNRPFDTRAHDPQSFVFNAEYPMVRWLEANGYDVKYWTGVDTDRFGVDPAIGLTSPHRPKAFFSVGHDEYWSAAQRAHVESARNSGVNLGFFSGNEMFWKTRYEPSIVDSNASYRTLVSYKETFGQGNRVDPDSSNPWTGTWRDPRFPDAGGGKPENALIGQLWMVNCCSDRIHVPASMAGLRFWRNTPVANLAPGDPIGYRLSDESLGYEWDEVIDNGFLPAGLVRMSTTTLIVPERVVDFGINIAQGTATHSLTLYRHNSGALVFGAGTVQWSWGLDDVHDRSQVGTNIAMQQATVNLLADMGAQPRTLQVGPDPAHPLLVGATMSADTVAPTSTIVSPAAGSSVESGSRVSISGTTLENGGGSVAGVEVSVDNGASWHTATVAPSGVWNYEWTPGSPGTATIRSRAFDDSGNVEGANAGIALSIVPGLCPCTSLWRPSSVPAVPAAADNNPVEVGTKFYSDIDGFITGVRFYKGTANTGTHVGNLWSTNGTRLATVTFSSETTSGWQQANFDSAVQITANSTYIVSYHTNVGSYAADGGYFATASIDSPPLHAPTTDVGNGNGVFSYGVSQFPVNTFNASNYWVDVVFAPTLDDSTPPVISLVKSTIIDSSRVTITWTTNEESTSKIQYSTDPAILSSATTLPPDTRTVSVGTFVTQHTIPLAALTPNTT
ncbi:MAG TPA: N,N-dimethylformamidase beta subunit family domain-containing protein, partial [Ilumatobacteraceae bacterium]